jgi:hypothetical protein
MITWLSTKSPHRMLDDPINPEIEDHLRVNHGVDSAVLAADLSRNQSYVEACQRRLGLRKFAPTGHYRKLVNMSKCP